MKLFGIVFASVSAVTWEKMDERRAEFTGRLDAEGRTRLSSRYDQFLQNALDAVPEDNLSVDGCQNVWGIDDESDDSFDPATATHCEYGRKLARNYLRLVKKDLCLDGLERGGKSLRNNIEKKFAQVVKFTRARDFCQ
ncbi:Oidioi.mRNA.OKI2018_I69.PAR.g9933.t1.cds [Oikopleura dioica]|uniref:Oidioi.mRNA.OKI2018_I69.PAR.g9933.t1.cds n=1 Tax=Oikopleura dioica TaxID=34765 RepID=A0ABN7RN02_OIKDI|nr:Oidioi.mRNA.OKI2018_I69.PAR.g9933.t1.cds [Oikopleura dioica]